MGRDSLKKGKATKANWKRMTIQQIEEALYWLEKEDMATAVRHLLRAIDYSISCIEEKA